MRLFASSFADGFIDQWGIFCPNLEIQNFVLQRQVFASLASHPCHRLIGECLACSRLRPTSLADTTAHETTDLDTIASLPPTILPSSN